MRRDYLESNTYVKIDSNSNIKIFSKSNRFIDKHAKCLIKNEHKNLTHYQWKSCNFYVMPKINKCQEILEEIEKSNEVYIQMESPNSLKGRPIIAGPNSPTQRLSSLLEKILTPLIPKLKSYIKDDWDFLKKLTKNLDPNFTFLMCDIVSLYTSILHELGVRTLLYYITRYRKLLPIRFSKEFILETAKLVLENNNFILLEEMFNQVMGTTADTKFAPPYANLSVGFLEETVLFPVELPKYFSDDNCKLIKELFKRYMDDGFLPWHSALDHNALKNVLNNLHLTIISITTVIFRTT